MKAKGEAPGPVDAHSADAGGCRVRISGGEVRKRAAFALRSPATSDAVRRLWERDREIWGADAAAAAATRLDWLDLPQRSRELLPEIERVRESLIADGLDHVVLVGAGASSLACEVICASTRVELTVLDTADPMQLRRALADRLERTVVVVASQPGSSIETDSHRRVYIQAFRDAGLDDAEIAARFIVVTDPESAVEEVGSEDRYRAVFLADPMVGGRYSALSAFGLVPSGLAGADVATLLDDAAALRPALGNHTNNPGLLLGAALAGAALHKRDKLALVTTDPALQGLGDWIEQLVAQSTCKQGRGVLPVLIEGADSPGFVRTARDVVRASIGSSDSAEIEVAAGPLGAQFLLWEWVAAFVCWAVGVNPCDQSDVTEDSTAGLLTQADPSRELGTAARLGDI